MPDPTTPKVVSTVCPYCGVGCGMLLHVEENKITKVEGDRQHPANLGKLCLKGANSALAVPAEDRLTEAYFRSSRTESLTALPLPDAIQMTARRLSEIIRKYGPDAVSFYVSGQLSMEAQYLANKLCKGYIGTNNIDSNSRLCMSSAASGYKLSLGADGPPGSYADFEKTGCFFVIGANMADCHPILFLRMRAAQRASGARLIVVDPRTTDTALKADLHLAIQPGTDLALLNGLLHLLVKNGRSDEAFIAQHTENWTEMLDFLKDYPSDRVAELTGLREADIQTAAQWLGESAEVLSLWTMGLNQSIQGTWNTSAICNLHLATGKICRPGSGPFSLTGQPNAMGGREMGYLSQGLPGQRVVTQPEDRAFIEKMWSITPGTIQPTPGLAAVELFQKIKSGDVKAVWIIGTNPVATMPNRTQIAEALQAAELVIVQDVYHPTETTQFADILLPGALWAEAEGVMVNSERMVTLMQKAIEPPGEACADWDIIARVARAMGHTSGFHFSSSAEVFDEIRQSSNPQTGYELSGISHRLLRKKPLQWPCSVGEKQGRAIRYVTHPRKNLLWHTDEIRFPTQSGRANFVICPHLPAAEMPDDVYPLVLTTGRYPHQWHTMTKTGKVAALNKLNPSPFLEIHPDDASHIGVVDGDLVAIESRRGKAILPAKITKKIRAGTCFAPFHWNEMFGENLAINAVTHDAVDPISKQPTLKFCAVHLQKIARPVSPEDASFSEEQKAYLIEFFAKIETIGV